MDQITQGDISSPAERELTSPHSPKRPRTDFTVSDNDKRRSRFEFPKFLTFQKTIGSQSSTSTLQDSAKLEHISECGDIDNEQLKYTTSIVTPISQMTDSHIADARTSKDLRFSVTAEKHFPVLVQDEQPPFTETDKLHWVDVAGQSLAVSNTSKGTNDDTSSHPDYKGLGKSVEVEPPGGCNVTTEHVQNGVIQIQALGLRSDEQVSYQSDCTHEDTLPGTEFCNTSCQSAEVKRIHQKTDEDGSSENILLCTEREEDTSPVSSSDYDNSENINLNPDEDTSGNLGKSVENENEPFDLKICEKENVLLSDGEIKCQGNVSGIRGESIPPTTECTEGSLVSCDVLLTPNTAIETLSLKVEVDDFCGPKGEYAAGKMIARAWRETADHTTETPMPERIRQEPAVGDNNAGPFSVTDPGIWSDTDMEGEEKRCKSETTADVELSSSVKFCEMDMPRPLSLPVSPSQEVSAPNQTQQFNQQSERQQCKDEKEEDLSVASTQPQACFFVADETHEKTGSEDSCLWKSGPSSSKHKPIKHDAGEGRQVDNDTAGYQLTEQDQCKCSPVSSDNLKTQEVEYLLTEIATIDRKAEMEKGEGIDELAAFENIIEKCLHQNEKCKTDTNEISNGICKLDKAYCNISPHIDEEFEKKTKCLSDCTCSAVTNTGTAEEVDVKEESDGLENLEGLVQTEDCQQKGDLTLSPDGCNGEYSQWANTSKRGCNSAGVSQHEQGNMLSCLSSYQQTAEISMGENKEELFGFTFPPASDAVVPGPPELIHSQNADNHNPEVLNCGDRFSSVPSAFAFCDRVPGVFDTFEKIQLSQDDDGYDDASLSNSPLLTSLPGQLLETPQRQLYYSMPEAESSEHEEVPGAKDEELENIMCLSENTANGFLSSDYSCNELMNYILAADVMLSGGPELGPDSESACYSTECFQDDLKPQSVSSSVSSEIDCLSPDVVESPQFEMKKQYDLVLKELNLYFEISLSDFASNSRASSPEHCSDKTETLEADVSEYKEHLNNLDDEHHGDMLPDDAEKDHSLHMCGSDPVVSCTPGLVDSEQEVPLGSRMSQKENMCTAEKYREPQEIEKKKKTWSPSFMCGPFFEQMNNRLPDPPRRLEPLRTCTRPLRVGLSRRAKTKRLHHPHPYK